MLSDRLLQIFVCIGQSTCQFNGPITIQLFISDKSHSIGRQIGILLLSASVYNFHKYINYLLIFTNLIKVQIEKRRNQFWELEAITAFANSPIVPLVLALFRKNMNMDSRPTSIASHKIKSNFILIRQVYETFCCCCCST